MKKRLSIICSCIILFSCSSGIKGKYEKIENKSKKNIFGLSMNMGLKYLDFKESDKVFLMHPFAGEISASYQIEDNKIIISGLGQGLGVDSGGLVFTIVDANTIEGSGFFEGKYTKIND